MLALADSLCALAQGHDPYGRVVEFRLPEPTRYEVMRPDPGPSPALLGTAWITAVRQGSSKPVQFGSRIALQTLPDVEPQRLFDRRRVTLARVVAPDFYILQAADPETAIEEAARLATLSDVRISYPVVRRPLSRHGAYAPRPNDTHFGHQWNLENRAADGSSLGVDLNLRAAWAYSLGQGLVLAVVDDGVDLDHPEFSARVHTLTPPQLRHRSDKQPTGEQRGQSRHRGVRAGCR